MNTPSIEILGSFHIPGLSGAREVRACLPRHAGGAPRPPLLVLFDDLEELERRGFGMEEATRSFAASGQIPPILLAIGEGEDSPREQLGPWATPLGGGELDATLSYLGDTLVPCARRELGATREVAQTILGGSGIGGVAALYGHLHRPDLFGGALALAPALSFADRRFLHFLDEQRYLPWSSRVVLKGHDVDDVARRLRDRGWCERRLNVLDAEGSVAPALDFLFGDQAEIERMAA